MQPLTLCKGRAVQSGIPGTGPDSLPFDCSGTENLVPTLIKDLLRVHTLALERKLGHRVPSKHPLIAWLVEHVALQQSSEYDEFQ